MDLNTKKTREYEYEIQFFGFTPDSFVNGGKLEFRSDLPAKSKVDEILLL